MSHAVAPVGAISQCARPEMNPIWGTTSSNSDVWLPQVRKCRRTMRPFRPREIKCSVTMHAKIYGKHVHRPTKARPARAKQSPFSTLVTKILKLKARVRLGQRARQIKLPKLIEQFA